MMEEPGGRRVLTAIAVIFTAMFPSVTSGAARGLVLRAHGTLPPDALELLDTEVRLRTNDVARTARDGWSVIGW